jgi:hypothetical protein
VGDVLELHSPAGAWDEDRALRIFLAAKEVAGGWNLLFVHTDGAGDPAAARSERVDPACQKIRAEIGLRGRLPVAVVPIRETEAWALANGDTLREVFGTSLGDEELGVPPAPAHVEGILDPKRTLEAAHTAAQGGRKGRRRRKAASMLEALGERVSLTTLERVPAFARLRQELVVALGELQYV